MTELIWIVGLGLALAAGLWLVIGSRPRKVMVGGKERRNWNARALREELESLEQQHRDGDLDDDAYQQARNQIESAAETDLQSGATWQSNSFGPNQKWLLALAPVLLTVVLFFVTDGEQHFAERGAEGQGQAQGQPPQSIEDMVAGLSQRLQSQPDDLRGWAMLGRSYQVMGRFAESAEAYARANQLSDYSNPELLIAEAETRGQANQQKLAGRPTELIDAALALDPNNIRALWYGLAAATQRGDGQARNIYLQRLVEMPDLPPELAEVLASEFDVQPVALAAADDSGASMQVEVDLAAGVREEIEAGATLFIYAKAQTGPPMPLAVHRQPVGEWPVSVRLDDSMSMMPSMKLSSFDAWTVVARISASGLAQPQSGDWMVSQPLNELPDAPVQLTIAEQIP